MHPAPGLAREMVVEDLRQSKEISHNLRRNDLLENIVIDLQGECHRLRGDIAQWMKLHKETLVNLERGNTCFEDVVTKRKELLLECERLHEENLNLDGKLNQAVDGAILVESELVDAYMKRSEMCKALLDSKDELTRFRNSNDKLRKKINDLRVQKRVLEVVDQIVQ
ncbi:hypothetical protein QYE76_053165 [Lolium multiflorum]|uniref:Uncharacterized protein n=1 Tax=Lolium multiflorum TaxID=4521 RepID=A0AAD8WK60_LOLMU|nr:hypothetical protein QYE76_053165 [Lolium multiflorum]